MSVVSGETNLSPPAEELKEGCICTVKRFEKNPAKVVAAGTKAEMNAKLNGLDDERSDDIEPPKKKTQGRREREQNHAKSQTKKETQEPERTRYLLGTLVCGLEGGILYDAFVVAICNTNS